MQAAGGNLRFSILLLYSVKVLLSPDNHLYSFALIKADILDSIIFSVALLLALIPLAKQRNHAVCETIPKKRTSDFSEVLITRLAARTPR